MRRIKLITLTLALLLTGCAGTATDEAAFGSQISGEALYTRTATDEEAFGPQENTEDKGAAASSTAESLTKEEPAFLTEQKESPAEAAALLQEREESAGSGREDVAAPPEKEDGFGGAAEPEARTMEETVSLPSEVEELLLEDEAVPLAAAPSTMLLPVAAGTAVKSGGGAEIDYSNVADGYVMTRFAAASSKRLRVQIVGPSTTYLYDLPTGAWSTFPLSDGNGSYKVTVLQNTTDKKYAILTSVTVQVSLTDEFAPFLRPNQYVDFSNATNTVAKAAELTKDCTDSLDKVSQVYNFVVSSLTYDQNKAASVQSGYLPVLDTVLSSKKGICFDYAALMTGMLRSQGVPCKLVVGYAGTQYHAWVSVWTEKTGWIDGIIYFDGTTWQRMDPTFASSGNSSEAIMKYIGDGKNYTVKYLY